MSALAMVWFVAALWAANCLAKDLYHRERVQVIFSAAGLLSCVVFGVMAL